jgi:hypothetical protein
MIFLYYIIKMQLDYVLEFLEFPDIVKLSHVCKQFNLAYIKYITLKSTKWVISQVDKYISCRQILTAERLLRYYICLNDISGNNPKMRNKFARDKCKIVENIEDKLLSKYIYIISTYIWDNQWYNPKYRNHRNEVYKFLRRRVNDNINDYSIYIPIDMYSYKNSDIPYTIYIPDKDLVEEYKETDRPDGTKYIIASIFAYICIWDKQSKLSQDIVIKIENKCKKYNAVYYLVKWYLTGKIQYLTPFKNSEFAFGMHVYSYELRTRNIIADQDSYIKILKKCTDLDPLLLNALNTILYNTNPISIDTLYTIFKTNPDHSHNHIAALTYVINYLLQDPTIFDNMTPIMKSIEDYISKNSNLYPESDLLEIKDIRTLPFSLVFITIHNMIVDQNLIIQNLILFYRLNAYTDIYRHISVSLLLYIQTKFKLCPRYTTYINGELKILNAMMRGPITAARRPIVS